MAAQTVTVSGSPATMVVQSAVAGSTPASVGDNSTTYTYVSPSNKARKIMAQLDAPMPSGVTLSATFDAPAGATNVPNVALDATPRIVVTNLPKTNGSTLGITYTLSATLSAGVVSLQTRTVTLTIADAP